MSKSPSPFTPEEKGQMPGHIAIIMDGNGRWAKKRGLPRIAGHSRGADSLKEAVKSCHEFGVKHLTVYAFSTENWARPKEEVGFLMGLLDKTIDKELDELHKNQVRLRFLGRVHQLPENLVRKMKQAMDFTSKNKGLNLNVMLSYGGRAEISDGMRAVIKEVQSGKLSPDDITDETLGNYLYTAGLPDPDLLIRTADELRVSNFLLWQIAYAEFYVTETLWPDFRRDETIKAIKSFFKRKRKFGKL